MSFKMQFIIFCSFVTIAICQSNVDSLLNDDSNVFAHFQACKRIHANNSTNRTFTKLSNSGEINFRLEFFVAGASDCHIILSPSDYNAHKNESVYHLLIGKSQTVLNRNNPNKMLKKNLNEHVLSQTEPVKYRIEASHGHIVIYRNDDILMKALDRAPIQMEYVSFGTDDAKHINIFYDCAKNNNNNNNNNIIMNPKWIHSASISKANVYYCKMGSCSYIFTSIMVFCLLYFY